LHLAHMGHPIIGDAMYGVQVTIALLRACRSSACSAEPIARVKMDMEVAGYLARIDGCLGGRLTGLMGNAGSKKSVGAG